MLVFARFEVSDGGAGRFRFINTDEAAATRAAEGAGFGSGDAFAEVAAAAAIARSFVSDPFGVFVSAGPVGVSAAGPLGVRAAGPVGVADVPRGIRGTSIAGRVGLRGLYEVTAGPLGAALVDDGPDGTPTGLNLGRPLVPRPIRLNRSLSIS